MEVEVEVDMALLEGELEKGVGVRVLEVDMEAVVTKEVGLVVGMAKMEEPMENILKLQEEVKVLGQMRDLEEVIVVLEEEFGLVEVKMEEDITLLGLEVGTALLEREVELLLEVVLE